MTLPQNRTGPYLTVDASRSLAGSESVLTVRNNTKVYLTHSYVLSDASLIELPSFISSI